MLGSTGDDVADTFFAKVEIFARLGIGGHTG